MTPIEAGVVDVMVVDPARGFQVLLMRRAAGVRCTGAWEVVHGRVEPGERPEAAALREVREETGCEPLRLYNLTCNPFYLHTVGRVMMAVVFVAFLDSTHPVQLGVEHDAAEWVPLEEALARAAWPRTRQGLRDAHQLLARGDAGPVDDVLRVKHG